MTIKDNPNEDKEARLVRIVQRLEAKVKNIWDENKELTQKLELANLDREIAQEQQEYLKNELSEATSKMRQLEELRNVNSELESTYLDDIHNLEQECGDLRSKLESLNYSAQNHETLRLELNSTKRRLSVAELELELLKSGYEKALTPLLSSTHPGSSEWLSLIDYLHLDVDESLNQYRRGDVTLQTFADLLATDVREHLATGNLRETVERQPPPSEYQTNEWWAPVFEAFESVRASTSEKPVGDVASAPPVDEEPPRTQASQREKTLLHKISVLESKLEKSLELASELKNLRNWQEKAIAKETEMRSELQVLEASCRQKEEEILSLRRKNVPIDMLLAKHRSRVADLYGTISFLASKQHRLVLDDLDIRRNPCQYSKLAGNTRVTKLRELASTFELGTSPEEAANLAIKQSVQLMFI